MTVGREGRDLGGEGGVETEWAEWSMGPGGWVESVTCGRRSGGGVAGDDRRVKKAESRVSGWSQRHVGGEVEVESQVMTSE